MAQAKKNTSTTGAAVLPVLVPSIGDNWRLLVRWSIEYQNLGFLLLNWTSSFSFPVTFFYISNKAFAFTIHVFLFQDIKVEKDEKSGFLKDKNSLILILYNFQNKCQAMHNGRRGWQNPFWSMFNRTNCSKFEVFGTLLGIFWAVECF